MRPVRPELQSVFSTVWVQTPKESTVQLSRVPDGCADLIWCDGTLWILGPRLSPTLVAMRSAVPAVGLRFQPGAAATWLETSAPELIGVFAPLDFFDKLRALRINDVLRGASDAHTVATRLEHALLSTLSEERILNRTCIGVVMHLLEHESGKGAFAEALRCAYDLSERSVRRETIRIFGYGPKTLERIYRVQRFLRLTVSQQTTSLASLASVVGFSDQAHMTREVRALAGCTPGRIRFVQDVCALPTLSSEYALLN